MRRFLAWVLLAGTALTVTGCGGCGELTQADMKARAIRRSNDRDETPPPPPVNPAVAGQKPPQQQQNAKPAPAAPRPAVDTQPPVAAATDSTAPAGAAEASLPAEPAAPQKKPVTLAERRQRSIQNLTAIGTAFQRHTQVSGKYPPVAIKAAGRPLLSWRVLLLPYLGYAKLYEQFHLQEPWDSPHNKALIAQIPPVYQSPERLDEKTNYLMPVEGLSPFRMNQLQPNFVRGFEDKPENTLIVLEAADEHAVPWTKPEDFDVGQKGLAGMLGKLRSDGLFVVWGDGRVGLLPKSVAAAQLKAFLTKDAGDNGGALASVISPAPPVEPAAEAVATDSGGTPSDVPSGAAAPGGAEMPAVVDPLAGLADGPTAPAGATPPATPAGAVGEPAMSATPESRAAVPDALALNKAQVLFKEIYGERLEAARTRDQKSQFARQMLHELPRVEDDPAGQYVLLDSVREAALAAGDAATVLKAVDEIGSRFDVDATAMRIDALGEFARAGAVQDAATNQIVLTYAVGLVKQAYAEDNFAAAQRMYDIAITAARRTGNQKLIRSLQQAKQEMDVARAAYVSVENVLEELEANPDEPHANLVVGRYYCFIKGNWTKGLPLLARSDDTRLRSLAEAELDPPALAEQQVALADRWWSVGTDYPQPVRRHMQLRGVTWYQKALPQLAEGLQKVKVEVRLKEAQRTYGSAVALPAARNAAALPPRGTRTP